MAVDIKVLKKDAENSQLDTHENTNATAKYWLAY